MAKEAGEPKPWTKDEPMLDFKFTNVFRELDKGTVSLRKMEQGQSSPKWLLWNTMWYRLFNRYEHASDIGWNEDYDELRDKMTLLYNTGNLIFTSAHMTVGKAGEPKITTMLNSLSVVYEELDPLLDDILKGRTLESAFRRLQRYMGIGPFISYEMVSDLRHHILSEAPDIMSWCNLGPGCKRGLERLGKFPHIDSCIDLLSRASENVGDHLLNHVRHKGWPYFELREIEHSLCEFDKHQRLVNKTGKPREKYNGRT